MDDQNRNINLNNTSELLLRHDTALGRIELTTDGFALTSARILSAYSPATDKPDSSHPVLSQAAAELDEFFERDRRSFTVPLNPTGTVFQRSVWRELRSVEWGATISYGELGARVLGKPAGRAVGSAVRANQLAIFIPCHRVLDAHGRITGYSQGYGTSTKLWLLAHEGVLLGAS